MALTPAMSCKELCGRVKPCGNVFCSNNPNYRRPTTKKKKTKPVAKKSKWQRFWMGLRY